jgi:hypothetical protein
LPLQPSSEPIAHIKAAASILAVVDAEEDTRCMALAGWHLTPAKITTTLKDITTLRGITRPRQLMELRRSRILWTTDTRPPAVTTMVHKLVALSLLRMCTPVTTLLPPARRRANRGLLSMRIGR